MKRARVRDSEEGAGFPLRPGPEGVASPRLSLRLVEFHVAHHCNLTCSGCSHFSPPAPPSIIDVESIGRDVALAGRLLEPSFVHILGGEPLLHPALPELLPIFRRWFSRASIKFVTNGVLLPTCADRLLPVLAALNITLSVSIYPSTRSIVPRISQISMAAGVALDLWQQDTFLDFLNPAGDSDPIQARRHCSFEGACNIRDGRVFPCPISAWGDFGGLGFSPDDGIPLETPLENLKRILDCGRVTSACHNCAVHSKRIPHRMEKNFARELAANE